MYGTAEAAVPEGAIQPNTIGPMIRIGRGKRASYSGWIFRRLQVENFAFGV